MIYAIIKEGVFLQQAISHTVLNELFIHERKCRRHWTQEYVAEKVGASVRTIQRWESGEVSPDTYFSGKLEELFDKKIEKLGWPGKNEISNWHVDYILHPIFTGREDVLKWLHTGFRLRGRDELASVQALTGLGGIGKSQIAIAYAYKFKHEYQTIMWLRAENSEKLAADFAAIAEHIGLPEQHETNQDKQINAVIEWLKHEEIKRWLLIFDGADDPEIIKEILQRYIPRPCQGHVILTTRLSATGLIEQCKEIDALSIEESIQFLLRRAKIAPTEANNALAKTLVKELGGLPLALDQAGAYIDETKCGIEGYLDSYQTEDRKELLEHKGDVIKHDPVATTFSLTFQKISKANPLALFLLYLFAVFAPDNIPEELARQGASGISINQQNINIVEHPKLFEDAIGELLRHSLIRRSSDTKTCNIHVLVQTCMKDKMDEELKKQVVDIAMRSVNSLFPTLSFSPLSSTNSYSKDYLSKCRKYLAHALACESHIELLKISSAPAVQLLSQLGEYFRIHHRYIEAERCSKKLLSLCEQRLLDHSVPQTNIQLYKGLFAHLNNLIQIYLLRRKILTQPQFELYACTINLATVYFLSGSHMEAEHLFLRIIKEISGYAISNAKRYFLALAFEGMSAIYSSKLLRLIVSDYEAIKYMRKPIKYMRKAIAVYKPIDAKNREDAYYFLLAQFYYKLASVYTMQESILSSHDYYKLTGKYAIQDIVGDIVLNRRAKKASIQAKNHLKKSIGLENIQVAELLKGIGSYGTNTGLIKFDEAEIFLKEALSIYEKTVGSEHPSAILTLLNIGYITLLKGNDEAANTYITQALNLVDKVFAFDYEHLPFDLLTYLLAALNNIAQAYEEKGMVNQVEQYYKRALTIYENSDKTTELDNQYIPLAILTMENYVLFLRNMKREFEATDLEKRIYSSIKE